MLFQILHLAMERLEREVIEPTRDALDPEERLRKLTRRQACDLLERGLEFALHFSRRGGVTEELLVPQTVSFNLSAVLRIS